jgi:hypothetical protein
MTDIQFINTNHPYNIGGILRDQNFIGIFTIFIISMLIPVFCIIHCYDDTKKKVRKSREVLVDNRINILFRKLKYGRILLDQRVNKLYKKTKKHSDRLIKLLFERINDIEHDLKILEKEHDKKKK